VVLGSASTTDRAVEKLDELEPDVVLLDVDTGPEGPASAVDRLLAVRVRPIVLVSDGSGVTSEDVLAALGSGAVDVIDLPPSPATGAADAAGEELASRLRLLEGIDVGALRRRHSGGASPADPVSTRLDAVSVGVPTGVGGADIVVIGASTGGPPALETLLAELPQSFSVPVLVCQHLPKGFTAAVAERLDGVSPLDVHEAADGDRLRSRLALLVPSGASARLERRERSVHLRVEESEGWEPYSPSIDAVMESAASVYGSGVLAVLLTGMSGDGAQGMLAVRRAGGHTVCEAESSARIHGMCRDAAGLGAVAEETDLSRMASLIMLRVGARS
jgi:two-component system chemotaxis response regulator CheB